jgi:type IV secretory pathway VirD2 relaxase
MGISQCASAAPSFCYAYSERVFSEPLIFMNRVTLDVLHTHTHLRACISPASTASHITFPHWKMMGKNDQRNKMHILVYSFIYRLSNNMDIEEDVK